MFTPSIISDQLVCWVYCGTSTRDNLVCCPSLYPSVRLSVRHALLLLHVFPKYIDLFDIWMTVMWQSHHDFNNFDTWLQCHEHLGVFNMSSVSMTEKTSLCLTSGVNFFVMSSTKLLPLWPLLSWVISKSAAYKLIDKYL